MKDACQKDILRVAVIGCGKITATRHAPEYAACGQAEIVGFFDAVEGRGRDMAATHGGRAFSSVDEILSSPDVDAISVCTANVTHADITVAALKAGKHVLCEKPMAITLDECLCMIEAARESGKRLMIAHNQRLIPLHVAARARLRDGAIGRPISFKTTFGHSGPDNWSVDPGTGNWFFDRAKTPFGAVADLGIHKIDLIRYLLDSEIGEVEAMLGTLDKRDAAGRPVAVDDNALILCRMENGMLGTVSASWTYYSGEDNSTVIYGSEGSMHLLPGADTLTIRTRDGKETVEIIPPKATTGVIDCFVSAVLSGTPSTLDAEAILPSMQAMLAAVQASESGKRAIL